MSQLTGAPLKTNRCTASKTTQLNWSARLRPASDLFHKAKAKKTEHNIIYLRVPDNVREEHVRTCDVSSLMAVTPFCRLQLPSDEMGRVSKGLQISRLELPQACYSPSISHTHQNIPERIGQWSVELTRAVMAQRA